MSRFKSQHQPSDKKLSSSAPRAVIYMIGIVAAAFVLWNQTGEDVLASGQNDSSPTITTSDASSDVYDYGLYTLKYNEDREQADWVRYTLTKDNLRKKRLPRPRDFYPDSKIKTGSAHPNDYRGSGYTRGHLVANADMSYDKAAQKSTFLMSNMSPQTRGCNGGIWRELEENVRDWGYKFNEVEVMSGPIWSGGEEEIGKSRVDVPRFYFKAILDKRNPEKKAIGFIIPNDVSYKHLNKYMVTIDDIELRTGIDLFDDLSINEQLKLESEIDPDLWPISDKRFELRTSQWNKN